MLEFSIMWLITIISSFINNMSTGLRMFKDVADTGYKIDIEHLSEILNQINSEVTKKTWLEMLIPFYNLYKSFKIQIQYSQNRDVILQQLDTLRSVEEMSEWEKIEYSKKPTGLNAIIVKFKFEDKLNTAIKIKLENNQGVIWYIDEEETKNIIILKAEGTVSGLSTEEQKQKIIEHYVKLYNDAVTKFGTFNNFESSVGKTVYNHVQKKIDTPKKSTFKQIEELKKLKDEITSEQTMEVKETGYQKINKKDK